MTAPGVQRLIAPGEEAAQERSWPAVRDAFAARERVPRRRSRRKAGLALAAAALVVAAVTPPGMAVAGYLHDRIVRDTPRPTVPAPLATGTPGRLLLTTSAGVWVLRGDGSGRLLGRYETGTWSPNGRFVAVTRGNALYAVEPGTGTVRWPLVRKAQLADVRWAPKDGFRIAYREGTDLRVVDGDGTHDRLLAHGVGLASSTWRPGSHVLAYDAGNGTIAIRDVDGDRVDHVPTPGALAALAYAPDGRRLVAIASGGLTVIDPATGQARMLRRRGPAFATSPAASGEVLALTAGGDVRRIALDGSGDRLVAHVTGAGELAWSPDGRTALVADRTRRSLAPHRCRLGA